MLAKIRTDESVTLTTIININTIMKIHNALVLLALLSLSPVVHSEAIVAVNAVNYPVWVERDQRFIPLSPGDVLQSGDVVNTGQTGRAWLSMADGSVVKLGQDAQFEITSANYEKEDDSSVLKAALNVLRGAFRFTTAFLKPERQSAHQVNIKIGAITAGIRGTDIWGRSEDDEDFITLLEGSISVEAEGEPVTELTDPLSLYLKKRGQAAEPVTFVDVDTVNALGAETELSDELGIANTEGTYQVVFMSVNDPENINQLRQIFRQQGYAVQAVTVEIDGEAYTRLLLQGFISLETATHVMQRLGEDFNLPDSWINRL